MIEFWNERYAASAYAYGKEPNQFLVETSIIFLKVKYFFLRKEKVEMQYLLHKKDTILV
jgi:hypothetical protein